jgi:ferredoxin-NADP reductase
MIDGPADPSSAVRWQTAAIVGIARRTESIKSIFLSPSEPFGYRSGQHVDLRLTGPDGYRAMRSYSIASAPDDSEVLELAIERLRDGEVSPYLHDVACVGDEVELRGPLGGHFVWSGSDGGPLLLVGGGSGVVPLVAMLRHRRAAAPTVPALLLVSARTWDDVPFRDELIEMEERSPSFSLVLTLTRERARRRHDFERRVDAAMMAEVAGRLPFAAKHVFICGSNAFANAAANGAVAAGLPASMVRTERYGA